MTSLASELSDRRIFEIAGPESIGKSELAKHLAMELGADEDWWECIEISITLGASERQVARELAGYAFPDDRPLQAGDSLVRSLARLPNIFWIRDYPQHSASAVSAFLKQVRRAVQAEPQSAQAVWVVESRDPLDGKDELKAVQAAIRQLKGEEAAAVQGQIAGIRAGASADAYALVFADIAHRRQELEAQRRMLASATAAERGEETKIPGKSAECQLIEQALADANGALTDPEVPALEKRNLIGALIQKVIPNKDGADIHFVPGAFVGPEDETASRSTFHTTCIGIKTQK